MSGLPSRNITEHTCQTCGKTFEDYASARRKYCSKQCAKGKRNMTIKRRKTE